MSNREFEERVIAAAADLADAQRLNGDLERAAAAAKQRHGAQWDAAFERRKAAGALNRSDLEQIVATDAPDEVLFALGDKPEQLHRLQAMNPIQRQAELAKIGVKAAMPKSKPAATTTSAGGLYDQARSYTGDRRDAWTNARGDTSDNDAKWFAERRKQKENSAGRPWSPKR
jgi:hypothetical protein